MISVAVTDHASPALRQFLREVRNPIPALKVGGRAVVNVLRAHFRAKDRSERNKLGGKREHFWLQIGRSVHNPVPSGAAEVTVAIADPRMAQKIKGGTITATKAGALTIPLVKEAYGRRASVLERALGIGLFKIGNGSVFGAGQFLAGVYRGKLIRFYLLRKSVRQNPDPSPLPSNTAMAQAAAVAMHRHFELAKLRAGL